MFFLIQKHLLKSIKALIIFMLIVTSAKFAHSQSNHPNPNANNPNQEILDRLAILEDKIDDLSGPQTTATFCMSQGRELTLGADWILQIDMEFEAGVGWAEVFSGEATAEAKIPAGPIPSETAIGVGGSKGRGLDICIDLPINLGPTDTALLTELALDINAKADDFPNRGKFQRRTHRLLNYTKRRVPGIQSRVSADQEFSNFVMLQEDSDSLDSEFDLSDDAVENIFNGGLRGGDESFSAFKNDDIRALIQSIDGLPSDVIHMVDNPEQILDPVSDAVNNGIDNMNCATFGIDAGLRNEKAGLDDFCARLEAFPAYSDIERVFSGELIGELFAALDTLTLEGTANNVKDGANSTFCATRIGQLPKFDKFCKR